jgi:hypothetical protein
MVTVLFKIDGETRGECEWSTENQAIEEIEWFVIFSINAKGVWDYNAETKTWSFQNQVLQIVE